MKIVYAIIVFVLIVVTCEFYQIRIRYDWERCGVIVLRGGYRAWWIRYSEGILMSDPPKVMWCFPRYEHYDVRPFLRKREVK